MTIQTGEGKESERNPDKPKVADLEEIGKKHKKQTPSEVNLQQEASDNETTLASAPGASGLPVIDAAGQPAAGQAAPGANSSPVPDKEPEQLPNNDLAPKAKVESTEKNSADESGKAEVCGITGHEHQHHVKIYSEVLEKTIPIVENRAYKHPLAIDVLLAGGLLVAVGGFTLGLIKFYITQEAKLDISQRHYSQAISLLRGAPLPGWFSIQSDKEDSPEELLNQAYYLDAMDKLDAEKNDASAIKELEKIQPGSRFHDMANEILDATAPRSAITLQGNVEHEATKSETNSPEANPLLPEPGENK